MVVLRDCCAWLSSVVVLGCCVCGCVWESWLVLHNRLLERLVRVLLFILSVSR